LIGIAVDPDVDRCVLIDNHGKPLGEEYTLALAVEFYLSHSKSPAVCKNLSSSRAIDDICAKHNVKVVATAVGEINVSCLWTPVIVSRLPRR
jgi:phosphomannomutase